MKSLLKSFGFWGFIVLFVVGLFNSVTTVRSTGNGKLTTNHMNPLGVLFESLILGLIGYAIGWIIQKLFFRRNKP